METAFEYIFYAGLITLAIGAVWFLVRLIRGPRKTVWVPLLVMVLGAGLMATPATISKNLPVDLGARKTIVDGEVHLGLTGWDGESYAFLPHEPDVVVLQMANADVTDETLQYLSGMEKLRDLDLAGSKITDAGLSALSHLKSLQDLRLNNTRITDAGFKEHVMPLEKLKRLDLRGTAISAEAIAQWKAAGEGRRASK